MADPSDVDAPGETMGSVLGLVADYEAQGYTGQFKVRDGGRIECTTCGTAYPAEDVTLDSMRRYEGTSDPGDEMIVTALTCPCGAKGTILFTYGPLAPPEESEALKLLTDRRESTRKKERAEAVATGETGAPVGARR